MEIEKRRNLPAVGRRIKPSYRGEKGGRSAPERKRGEGVLAASGVLILALVAFFSGAWMAKAISDAHHPETSAIRQSRAMKDPSIPWKIKSGPSRQSRNQEERKEAASPRPSPEGLKTPPEKGASFPENSSPTEEASSTPLPSRPRYTLQIGAYSNAEEARNMVNQLRSKGYQAFQATGTAAAKGEIHRVRVGQFQTLQEARQFALTFEKKEKMKTLISNLP